MADLTLHCEVDYPSLWETLKAWLRDKRAKTGAPTTFRAQPGGARG